MGDKHHIDTTGMRQVGSSRNSFCTLLPAMVSKLKKSFRARPARAFRRSLLTAAPPPSSVQGRGGDMEAAVRKVLPKDEQACRKPTPSARAAAACALSLPRDAVARDAAKSALFFLKRRWAICRPLATLAATTLCRLPLTPATPHTPLPQIVIAILSCYGGLFGLYKIKSAFSAKPPVPTPAPVSTSVVSTGIGSKWGFEPPTIDTFDEWEKNDDNWTKWEAVRGYGAESPSRANAPTRARCPLVDQRI